MILIDLSLFKSLIKEYKNLQKQSHLRHLRLRKTLTKLVIFEKYNANEENVIGYNEAPISNIYELNIFISVNTIVI